MPRSGRNETHALLRIPHRYDDPLDPGLQCALLQFVHHVLLMVERQSTELLVHQHDDHVLALDLEAGDFEAWHPTAPVTPDPFPRSPRKSGLGQTAGLCPWKRMCKRPCSAAHRPPSTSCRVANGASDLTER